MEIYVCSGKALLAVQEIAKFITDFSNDDIFMDREMVKFDVKIMHEEKELPALAAIVRILILRSFNVSTFTTK